MQITVSDWNIADGWKRYNKGTKFRHITYDCVTCSQYIGDDGVKHYEFFSSKTKRILDDFSSPQMQAVDNILYFIKHENSFKTVEESKKSFT